MAIRTYTRAPGEFRAVVFDGTPETIDEIRQFAGDRVDGVIDGTIIMRMLNGEITLVKRGWAVYDERGVVSVASEGVVGSWLPA